MYGILQEKKVDGMIKKKERQNDNDRNDVKKSSKRQAVSIKECIFCEKDSTEGNLREFSILEADRAYPCACVRAYPCACVSMCVHMCVHMYLSILKILVALIFAQKRCAKIKTARKSLFSRRRGKIIGQKRRITLPMQGVREN